MPYGHKLPNAWCLGPGSAYRATGNATLYPPQGAWKPGHHSLLGGESIQAHHPEPGAILGHQGTHPSSKQVTSLLVLANHDGCLFSPVGIDQPGGEPLFRELINKPADSSLDVNKVHFGDLESPNILGP